ncbi:hypothetical protein J7J35_04090 [Candidatus Bipolaricaulota bacterium]|nr:hypothetical protein [Candidatus Bipolaricaulota bacterium]
MSELTDRRTVVSRLHALGSRISRVKLGLGTDPFVVYLKGFLNAFKEAEARAAIALLPAGLCDG